MAEFFCKTENCLAALNTELWDCQEMMLHCINQLTQKKAAPKSGLIDVATFLPLALFRC